MKNKFKKIITSLCALVLCIVCFSGCSWLEINKNKYYNQIVATVGNKSFTKKDLTEAFSTYGYQYYQNSGNLEESVKQTLKSMIERELLLDEIKSNSKYDITDTEKLEIKKQAFDNIQESLNSISQKVRKEWDMEIKFEDKEEKKPLRDAETEYNPTTEYLNGQVSRIKAKKDKIIVENLPEHFTKDYQVVTDKRVCDEAWARFIKSLQDSAKNEGRSTNEKDVLLHEENRLIEILTNNKYLEKYEEEFFNNVPVNTSAILEYYREQYKAQKETFEHNKSAYHKAMEESSKNYIYYHVNSGHEYVNVKHILLNFNETQKEDVKNLQSFFKDKYKGQKDENGKDFDYTVDKEYIRQLEEIAFDSTVKRDYEIGDNKVKMSATQVIDYVYSKVNGSFTEKSKEFNKLIYLFNDDPGIMNSEFDYVVNLDTDVEDKMVKPFANGVRELDESNGGKGKGSMKAVISDYGIHIIFHDGVASNIILDDNIDNISDEELLSKLCLTNTTPDSNKSIFNFIYDTLKLDENLYNDKTTIVIESIKTNLKNKGEKITYYENNYKDLWK